MEKIDVQKMEVENAFTKCGNIDDEIASAGNCYGDGDGGWSCDSDSCDAPPSDWTIMEKINFEKMCVEKIGLKSGISGASELAGNCYSDGRDNGCDNTCDNDSTCDVY